jgi:hypothetical protein
MAWVNEASIDDASRAVVPIWAVEALVANSVDVFVTSITDCIVAGVASRAKESLRDQVEVSIFDSRDESVLGVMAVLLSSVARNAEVVVLARCAGNEVLLREFCSFISDYS